MDLRVLGEVQIRADDRTIDLERSAERCVLATLAFNPSRPVQVDTLIENVWGDQPPARAEQTIASYVRAVRRAIEDAGGQRAWLLNRRPRAYELRINPAAVDYHRFTALAAAGRAKARDGDHHDAIVAYQHALALWQANPLANVNGDWADRRRHRLRQERLDTHCALFEQQIKTGDHEAVASGATRLIDETVPTDRLIALAIHALANCGYTSMIPGFVSRAAEHMWNAVQVLPSSDIDALARSLVNRTTVNASHEQSRRHPPPPAEHMGVGPDAKDPSGVEDPAPMAHTDEASTEGRHDGHTWQRNVSMSATLNENVFQCFGDQHIYEA
ncbi:BTAD domain-containing putative transcriptional regulator [Micromonospora sp. WMMD1082]|uniref:AfsR/SARP family transcriptional regulator n=1 Tax=Micromonospora sp. WMMD1082 TaxID=3016104 RepID=UPI0024173B07|nr:BTAD domain-containing putative transcriptional regulator [Micromonospora sp. WMMD1082]MDG4796293.1 BTAD domain-containing putative transcriptional regulator [Micromonospora sp. WMMD1082]